MILPGARGTGHASLLGAREWWSSGPRGRVAGAGRAGYDSAVAPCWYGATALSGEAA